jgi:hypothetical protein
MALPVRLFAQDALKSSTRCLRRRRAGRNVKPFRLRFAELPSLLPAFSIRIIHLR